MRRLDPSFRRRSTSMASVGFASVCICILVVSGPKLSCLREKKKVIVTLPVDMVIYL